MRSSPLFMWASASVALLLSAAHPLRAQQTEFHCGANEIGRMGDLVAGHPERVQEIAQSRAALEHFTQAWEQSANRDDNTYIIPVVFHIIHNNGPENISNEQVFDAVRVMNEDWNKLNADWNQVQPEFLDRVADMKVTFKLAQLDPSGNCTNGITRTVSSLTTSGDQNMKNLIQWPRNRYLNIWVSAGAGGAAGYSMYPSSVSGSWGAAADGIVILSNYVGSIGTSDTNKSHSLSHEAGHWLNLMHCWGDSNNPGLPENCGSDDGVADTPNTIGWTSCNLRGATCGSAVDNVENFMEYSYCSKMFTNGQKARVYAALNSATASRNNLWTPANLALTGVSQAPQICAVAFTSNRRTICAGESVTFTDGSYNGVTQWAWTFPGGSPATATAASPSVSYDAPGTYSVALSVGNGVQSLAATQQEFITVLPSTGVALPVAESFEGNNMASTIWEPSDAFIDASFQVSGQAGYTGSHSVKLVNVAANAGRTYELSSSTVDITGDPPAVISFRYAYAKRTASNNDALRVYASRDCGQTWSMRRALTGDGLVTAPVTTGSFTPNGPGQWGYSETSPIGGLYAISDLRFKFVFQSTGGNNLWLDDININGASVGVAEHAAAAQGMLVVPNPARDRAEVTAFLKETGKVKAELVDLVGRPVKVIAEGAQPAGEVRWNVGLEDLPAGMYFVRVQQGGNTQVAKFTKE